MKFLTLKKTWKNNATALLASALVVTPVSLLAAPWQGPFGTEQGLSALVLGNAIPLKKEGQGLAYSSKTAPNPHPSFEAYTFIISASSGLCRVNATGKDVITSSFGDELKAEFGALRAALIEKYGPPTNDFDFVQSGSIWNERRDFMMGLYKKERVLASFWSSKENPSLSLPNNLATIGMEARALSGDKGWVSLTYEYNNTKNCEQESLKAKNSAL